MNQKKRPPLALKIIGYLCILAGISSLIDMISSFMTNHIKVNLGVIELFIGFGLLKGNKTWRNLALGVTWLMFIAIPFICIMFLTKHTTTTEFKIFGQEVTPVDTQVVIIFGTALLIYQIWQYAILNREDVKAYFDIKD